MRTHLALKGWARPAAGSGLPSASPYAVGVGESSPVDRTRSPKGRCEKDDGAGYCGA